MSVKSIGYKSAKVVSGTYTTPKLTVNRAGQITEIQSQVIDPDDTEAAAYETLVETMEDVDTALATVTTSFANLSKYQGLDVNYSLYVQLQEKYDELAKASQEAVEILDIENFTTRHESLFKIGKLSLCKVS